MVAYFHAGFLPIWHGVDKQCQHFYVVCASWSLPPLDISFLEGPHWISLRPLPRRWAGHIPVVSTSGSVTMHYLTRVVSGWRLVRTLCGPRILFGSIWNLLPSTPLKLSPWNLLCTKHLPLVEYYVRERRKSQKWTYAFIKVAAHRCSQQWSWGRFQRGPRRPNTIYKPFSRQRVWYAISVWFPVVTGRRERRWSWDLPRLVSFLSAKCKSGRKKSIRTRMEEIFHLYPEGYENGRVDQIIRSCKNVAFQKCSCCWLENLSKPVSRWIRENCRRWRFRRRFQHLP